MKIHGRSSTQRGTKQIVLERPESAGGPLVLTIQALPLAFENTVLERLPTPSPPRVFVQKAGKVLRYEDGRPVVEDDWKESGFRRRFQRVLTLQSIAFVYEGLKADGIRARAISMPCWEIFDQQSPDYRESVLPSAVTARVAVEQAAVFGWQAYVGPTGKVLGMTTFGASAPIKDLLPHFGFTTEHVVAAAKEQLGRKGT